MKAARRKVLPRLPVLQAAALAGMLAAPVPALAETWESLERYGSESAEGWVEGKLEAMTLREKIGQMLMIDVPGASMTPELAAHLADGHYGNVIFFDPNIKDEDQTRLFIRQMQTQVVVQTGVPLLVAVDQEGGRVSRLKALIDHATSGLSARTMGQVAKFAPARSARVLARLAGALAQRMHFLGFNMNLAPVLDLTGDRKSYIYDRSFGDDPELVSRVTGQYADAMQANGVVATGKHFPNLSVTRLDSHRDLPVLDRTLEALCNHEFVPFKKLKDRLGAVMVGHVMVPDIDPKHPASISPAVIRALRQTVGWQGVVITDDLKMKALTDRYPLVEILIRAIYADIDILLLASGMDAQRQAVDLIERAVTKGKVSTHRIDESVRRILALKYRFAL